MQVISGCGHVVHEDVPDKVSSAHMQRHSVHKLAHIPCRTIVVIIM